MEWDSERRASIARRNRLSRSTVGLYDALRQIPFSCEPIPLRPNGPGYGNRASLLEEHYTFG